MPAHAPHRLRLSEESGFGIIEVLVSAMIVVVISLGVLAAVDAAGRTSATNKARSAAANLASQDQERLRAKTVASLANLNETREVTVDRRKYTVVSQGGYIVGGAGSANCASSEEAPRYLKMSSTVTWDGMTVAAVKQDSLRAIPNRSLEGSGSLAVDINQASGAGTSGIVVTITGPTTKTATTNAQGCAIFGFIPTGSYTVSYSQSPYINADNPGKTAISETAVVAENAIASKSFLYDRPATLNVAYKVSNWGADSPLADVTAPNDGFTVASGEWGVSNTRAFPTATTSTSSTGAVLFPFTSGYSAWTGRCDSNQPPGAATGTGAPAPNGSATANIREFRLRFRLRRRTSDNTTSTTNYGTVPASASGGAYPQSRVLVKPTDSSCTAAVDATHLTSTGSGASAVSTWEAIVPWGSYTVCAHYWTGNNASSQRAAVPSTGANTTDTNGTTVPSTTTWITIPWPTRTTDRACT